MAGEKREYGHAIVDIKQHRLFGGLGSELEVWMSHGKSREILRSLFIAKKVGDKLSHLPDSFLAIASTKNSPFAGIGRTTLFRRRLNNS